MLKWLTTIIRWVSERISAYQCSLELSFSVGLAFYFRLNYTLIILKIEIEPLIKSATMTKFASF